MFSRKTIFCFISALLAFAFCGVAVACDDEASPFSEQSQTVSDIEDGSSAKDGSLDESNGDENGLDSSSSQDDLQDNPQEDTEEESNSDESDERDESDESGVCEHAWEIIEEISLAATCESAGNNMYQCSICKDFKREVINALGHIGGEANCTEAKICTRCEKPYGDPLDHIGGEATCTQAKICTRCEKPYGAPLGHLYINHEGKSPNCQEAGYTAYQTCGRTGCGYIEGKEILEGGSHQCKNNVCKFCKNTEMLTYKLSNNKEYYICTGLADKNCRFIEVLDEYNALPVKKIAQQAFMGIYTLHSVTIGKNIEEIGLFAFGGCINLVEVYNRSSIQITPNSNLTDDVSGALCVYAKAVYTTANYQSKITMTDGCFLFHDGRDTTLIGCDVGAKLVSIPEGVTKLNPYVFLENDCIEEIVVADTVTELPTFAFQACTALKKLTIGSGVKKIYKRAVEECTALQTVIFKAAEGWHVKEKEEDEVSMPLRTTLTDTARAAEYLTREYQKYTWFCE